MYYGWWIVGAAFISLFGGLCAGFYTVSVFLEPLQAEFGWSRTQLSLGFMFSSLFSGLLSPFTGFLVARYGVRNIQLTGALAVVIAMLSISMMSTLGQYYSLLLLQSAGLSFIGIIPCQTVVSKWFEERRGLAMGIVMAGVGSGGMTMIFVASQALDAFGWRVAYRILACIILFVVFPVILVLMKEKQPTDYDDSEFSVSNSGSVNTTDTSLSDSFGSITFWQLGLLMLLFGMIIGALTQHAIALLSSMNVQNASAYWSLALGVSVIGRLMFGRLADFVSKKYLLVICWILVFISIKMLFYSTVDAFYTILFSATYGLSLGAFITIMPLSIGDYFGVENFSRLLGFVQLFLVVGLAVGTVIMGRTFDVTGSYITGMTILLYIIASGFIVSLTMPHAKKIKRNV